MVKSKSRDEAVNESFSENSLKMMRKRYLAIDPKTGKQETPADMLHRVAKSLAEVEKDYHHDASFVKKTEEDFFNIMASKEYTPAGRTMTNAGSDTALIANCIVLRIPDSMDGIFQTLKEAALLQQAGSGLGFALDELRPAMSTTKRSHGVSSGPVSFLKVYNEAFGTIKQQGRHGANMAMMSVDHPDVLDFIRSKEQEGAIANFNISVKVTDDFMNKLVKKPDTLWYCTFKGKKVKPHKVLRYPNGAVYGVEEIDITVGQLFDELVNYAWTNGEPGIVFIDKINHTNPLPGLGEIMSSNPCGEQFLHPYDNCNLGSLNLAEFVKNGKMDWPRLRFATRTAVRMMDNVIDKFDFPVPQVTELANKNRRIGLGIMGFADMLYQLGIRYDSPRGFKMGEKVMGFITDEAHQMSRELAKEKGSFPNIKLSVFAKKGIKMRNAALTTVAPTGSISMMFDTSSGIEPDFALAYVKQDKDGQQYHYLNKYFEAELHRRKFSEKKINEIKEEITKTGSIQHIADLPKDLKDTFVISMDIAGSDHVKMQAAFQARVDNSISKTINFPNSATRDDIKSSFIQAWKLGCKSCTVYRDGSRNIQILNLGTGEGLTAPTGVPTTAEAIKIDKVPLDLAIDKDKIAPRVRPEVLSGKTYKIKTGYGMLYVTVNNDENGAPFEVFATIGKNGGFFQEQSEAICRLISLSLRSGVKVEEVIDNLKGIRGPAVVLTAKGTVLSLPDAIGQILEEHVRGVSRISEESVVTVKVDGGSKSKEDFPKSVKEKSIADFGSMPGCPECGAPLVLSEGCMSCKNCGFSRCG
ncbi:adenosylcobalamin-dependent ribonucleoside-diphosphate reductase [Patescibacteria group bacterium]|nr:adenosylcobalamin-dependent ribonucleoside-diphosphate reductase [Patescibacteria group bacterium]